MHLARAGTALACTPRGAKKVRLQISATAAVCAKQSELFGENLLAIQEDIHMPAAVYKCHFISGDVDVRGSILLPALKYPARSYPYYFICLLFIYSTSLRGFLAQPP
jgi:hypothetical protein